LTVDRYPFTVLFPERYYRRGRSERRDLSPVKTTRPLLAAPATYFNTAAISALSAVKAFAVAR
jgi:hypothetical protein